jgi:type I restriction enzyme M protein
LTPGRYVGFEEVEEDDEIFEAKMEKLTNELSKQFEKSSELEKEIKKNLKSIGFDI